MGINNGAGEHHPTPEFTETFDTLEDWVAAVIKRPMTWRENDSMDPPRGSFEPHGWAPTVKAAQQGWPDGIAKLVDAMARVQASVTFTPKPVTVVDVAGAYPLPWLAAAGEPECMVDARPRDDQLRPCITILVALSYLASWKPHQVENYGGALAAWIDTLEMQGFQVQLDGYMASTNGSVTNCVRFGIKTMGQQMDLSRLAFALFHTGCMRRLKFRWMEAMKRAEPHFIGSYGRSCVLPVSMVEPETIHIGGRTYGPHAGLCDTPAHAVVLLQSQLKEACEKAGVQIQIELERAA